MLAVYLKILPLILIFLLGFILRRKKLFSQEAADLFLKFNFYLAIPALVFLSVSQITLSAHLFLLPLSAIFIIFTTYFIIHFLTQRWNMVASERGVFFIGPMIMNVGFVMPFVLLWYGQDGVARTTMFDFANGLLTFTFSYGLAAKYGSANGEGKKNLLRKFISAPPIWALLLGLVFSIFHFSMPIVFSETLRLLSGAFVPLLLFSLGAYFSPKLEKPFHTIGALLLRFGLGGLLALLLLRFLPLQGIDRTILILCAMAPIGYNTLTFSSIEGLDKEFAARLVSFSILIGLIVTPLILFLTS